jgi:Recombination, repair and ssDNA binding protein UvsY
MATKIETPPLEAIIEAWTKDSELDSTEPGKEILRIPILHNKYNKFLTLHNLSAKKAGYDYAKMRKIKWQYYNGKMSQDDLTKYGWEPFQFTLKQDINVYLDGDDDLTKLKRKQAYHEEAASFCTNVMKELNNRTWQLKEFMAWERFIQGQY